MTINVPSQCIDVQYTALLDSKITQNHIFCKNYMFADPVCILIQLLSTQLLLQHDSWLCWYLTTLSDPKIRQEESCLVQCCYVCGLRSLPQGYAQDTPVPSVGWHSLKISCPHPVYACQPPIPIPHITLAGAETLDKAVWALYLVIQLRLQSISKSLEISI